jgi:hypothetical protein
VRIAANAPHGIDDLALARALFSAQSGERWISLLPTVLGGDERLGRVGGRWRLTRRASTRRRPGDAGELAIESDDDIGAPDLSPSGVISTLALATTGADPRRHRIARIAVVRFESGAVTARLDVVIGSGRRLSGYLRDAARVAKDELDDAPSFADVVPDVRAMLNGRSAFTYGARRAQAFIDAELLRAGLPGLDARLIELDTLAQSIMPGSRKPGLFAAAAELGIQHAGRAAPLAEAELVARVVDGLRDRLGAGPPRQIVDGATTGAPSVDLPLTREWLAHVPEGRGVYVVEDVDRVTLYVGKAVALRRRLSAYVARQPSLNRRFEALAVRAHSISTIVTDSDLEATLLEARLIRERQPAFNVARQTRPPTTIVRAAPDARSPVRLVGESGLDGARYFGPFESVSAARQALAVARTAYPAAFDRRKREGEAQRQAVLDVCRLLSGQKEPALDALRASMRAAATAGDQAEVGRLRNALLDVHALKLRTSDLVGLPAGWQLLILERVEPGLGRLHLVEHGRLIASADTDTSALPPDAPRLRRFADAMFGGESDATAVSKPTSWSPEDSTILLRWLVQARSRLEIQRLPPDDGPDRD